MSPTQRGTGQTTPQMPHHAVPSATRPSFGAPFMSPTPSASIRRTASYGEAPLALYLGGATTTGTSVAPTPVASAHNSPVLPSFPFKLATVTLTHTPTIRPRARSTHSRPTPSPSPFLYAVVDEVEDFPIPLPAIITSDSGSMRPVSRRKALTLILGSAGAFAVLRSLLRPLIMSVIPNLYPRLAAKRQFRFELYVLSLLVSSGISIGCVYKVRLRWQMFSQTNVCRSFYRGTH